MNRGVVEPSADGIDPGRIGKMMKDDHGNDAGGVEAIQLIAISGQFRLIERQIRPGLETRPFETETIGINSELSHPFDVFPVTVVAVASGMTGAPVAGDESSPFVVDVTFDLRGGRGGAPEKTGWKFQRLSTDRCRREVAILQFSRIRRQIHNLRYELPGAERQAFASLVRHGR